MWVKYLTVNEHMEMLTHTVKQMTNTSLMWPGQWKGTKLSQHTPHHKILNTLGSVYNVYFLQLIIRSILICSLMIKISLQWLQRISYDATNFEKYSEILCAHLVHFCWPSHICVLSRLSLSRQHPVASLLMEYQNKAKRLNHSWASDTWTSATNNMHYSKPYCNET